MRDTNDSVFDFEKGPTSALKYAKRTPPKMAAVFCRPGVLLTLLSCLALCQNFLMDGITSATISSIERRFQLTSQETGIIVSTSAFAGLLVIIFVSYFGGHGHKPRWLSAGALLIGFGSLLYGLPHFLADNYQISGTSDLNLCLSNEQNISFTFDEVSSNNVLSNNLSNFIYLFLIAQIFIGIGSTPLYTLGIVTLDDNVDVHKSGLHLGIFHGVATLGPALGFIGGGAMLSLFTEILLTSEVPMNPEDPQWIGAWWLGFIVIVPVFWMLSLALMLFPKELPGTAEIRRRKVSQAHKASGEDVLSILPEFGKSPYDFFVAVKYLLRNPTYVWIVISTVADLMLVVGFGTYLPKLIEVQFDQTAWLASVVVGIAVVGGGAVGTLCGGYLAKKHHWEVRQNLRFVIAITIINSLLCFTLFLRCDSSHSKQYDNFARNVECESSCSCSPQQYEPVCTPDGIREYFSPCHAGCLQSLSNNTFTDCICAPDPVTGQPGTVYGGLCPHSCHTYLPFAFGLFAMMFFLFLTWMPSLQALLRCVPERQRSLCLGLESVFGRIFGSLPSTIVVGVIFDSSCQIWQTDSDGKTGSCWIYDKNDLSWKMFVFAEVLTLIAIISSGLALHTYKSESAAERIKRLESVRSDKELMRGMSIESNPQFLPAE